MPLGLSRPGDRGFDLTPSWGSIYWGGALFWLVVDVERFVPMEDYGREVDQLINHLKSSELMPGYSEILMPGEIEARTRQSRLEGIEIDEQTWGQIVECGRRFDVDVNRADRA